MRDAVPQSSPCSIHPSHGFCHPAALSPPTTVDFGTRQGTAWGHASHSLREIIPQTYTRPIRCPEHLKNMEPTQFPTGTGNQGEDLRLLGVGPSPHSHELSCNSDAQ